MRLCLKLLSILDVVFSHEKHNLKQQTISDLLSTHVLQHVGCLFSWKESYRMAKSRCIPTNLFFQRKFVTLSSDTVRLILIGLVSDADDAGRGLADSHLLSRKLDHMPEVIEQALRELETAGFVQCYHVEDEWYYTLPCWHEWQTLHKPTPSKYPSPPQVGAEAVTLSLEHPKFSELSPENPGKSRESVNEGEDEEKRTEGEGEVHDEVGTNVVAFPATAISEDEQHVRETTRVVARILKLSETPALRRLVEEYSASPHLSLLGEADAAREWIDDRKRNRQGQRMTPAFFRRWLKREMEAVQQREAERARHMQATGTAGVTGTPGQHEAYRAYGSPGQQLPPSLMNLEAKYRRERHEGQGKQGGQS